MKTTVALLNRYLPPAPGATGAALFRLAAGLARRAPDLRLTAIGADLDYAGGVRADLPADLPPMEILRLASWQRAGGGWRRLPATLMDGWRMAGRAASGNIDAVLSGADPPLLSFWLAARLPAGRRRVEWCMDLYPDALGAACGLSPGWWPGVARPRPDLRLCLGPGQENCLAKSGAAAGITLILPAGILDPPSRLPDCGAAARPPEISKPLTLVYAGNLGRAHSWRALEMLARMPDPSGRRRLIVAAHGVGAARLRPRLAGLPGVVWRDTPLGEAEMNAADVHVVSLRRCWTHVCVPSKAVSALCRGRPVLFFGAAESDAWGWATPDGARDGGTWKSKGLSAAGWRVTPGPDDRPDPVMLRLALDAIETPTALHAATQAARLAGERLRRVEAATLDRLAEWLTTRCATGRS